MKLLVISHTPHYLRAGETVGWGPTIRELDVLAETFGELVHLAVQHVGVAPESAMPYRSGRVRFVPLPPSGGAGLVDKLGILRFIPIYFAGLIREIRAADVVQVRCPAGISLLALLVLVFSRRPLYRWFKYAGNWRPDRNRDPLSYRFQRWLLERNLARGPVTINGSWTGQPHHVHTFDNPCLTDAEIRESRQSPPKSLTKPLEIVFAGRTEAAKGLETTLAAVNILQAKGAACRLDILGDGPDRPHFEMLALGVGPGAEVSFHGWLNRTGLNAYYEKAHFILFPSSTEGWPKVLSEAMAYGVVPVAAAVASIPQVLEQVGCGAAVGSNDPASYAEAIQAFAANPDLWQTHSLNGKKAAGRFTYSRYASEIENMLRAAWPEYFRAVSDE